MLSLLSFLILGTLFGGFVIIGVLAMRESETGGPAADRTGMFTHGPSDTLIHGLERRLRAELAAAEAYADDPSVDTLWASTPEEIDA